MGPLHDRSDGQTRLFAALSAGEDTGAGGEAEGLSLSIAMRANEAFGPFGAFEIVRARLVVWEELLEARQGLGKWQIVALEYVCQRSSRHGGPPLIPPPAPSSPCLH